MLTSCTSIKLLVISVDPGRAQDRAPTQLTCSGVALCPPWGYRSNSIYALVQDMSILRVGNAHRQSKTTVNIDSNNYDRSRSN